MPVCAPDRCQRGGGRTTCAPLEKRAVLLRNCGRWPKAIGREGAAYGASALNLLRPRSAATLVAREAPAPGVDRVAPTCSPCSQTGLARALHRALAIRRKNRGAC